MIEYILRLRHIQSSEFIAQGGNGKVYKAEDSRNRIIAIKVVLREQGSKLARFSNED